MKRKYQVTIEVETEESEKALGGDALAELFSDPDLLLGECGSGFGGSVDIIKIALIAVKAIESISKNDWTNSNLPIQFSLEC